MSNEEFAEAFDDQIEQTTIDEMLHEINNTDDSNDELKSMLDEFDDMNSSSDEDSDSDEGYQKILKR